MASGSNNTTKTTAASASLDPGRKYGTSDSSNRLRANVYDIDDDEEECEEVAATGSSKGQTTKKPRAKGPMDMFFAPTRKDADLSWKDVSEASGAHEPFYATRSSMAGTGRGDDEAGPSRKDKGKRVLYDEDEIEEDIGLTDVEEDDRVPGYDD
ncbi:hypothetical protein E3N88_18019 [Mikania micrantha]|uniref:Uncharacterized protein n=1 Tax=Mikania micrantha TaxID=192012 RepID=A0A5N6NVA0_9ASTR|nr:hypothetical protein E3N88_18019 [Mikania micrantha]